MVAGLEGVSFARLDLMVIGYIKDPLPLGLKNYKDCFNLWLSLICFSKNLNHKWID
jgi:hypothetical protein